MSLFYRNQYVSAAAILLKRKLYLKSVNLITLAENDKIIDKEKKFWIILTAKVSNNFFSSIDSNLNIAECNNYNSPANEMNNPATEGNSWI